MRPDDPEPEPESGPDQEKSRKIPAHSLTVTIFMICLVLYFSYTDAPRLVIQLVFGAAAGWIFSSTNREIESMLYWGRQVALPLRLIAFPTAITLLGLLLFYFRVESTSILIIGLLLGHLRLQQKYPVHSLSEIINVPYGGAYQISLITPITILGFVSAALAGLDKAYIAITYMPLALYFWMASWNNWYGRFNWRWYIARLLAVLCSVLAIGFLIEVISTAYLYRP